MPALGPRKFCCIEVMPGPPVKITVSRSKPSNFYRCTDGKWRTCHDLQRPWKLGSSIAAWKKAQMQSAYEPKNNLDTGNEAYQAQDGGPKRRLSQVTAPGPFDIITYYWSKR